MHMNVHSDESDMESTGSAQPELKIDTKLPSDKVFDCPLSSSSSSSSSFLP
jgi:hypothetical protein